MRPPPSPRAALPDHDPPRRHQGQLRPTHRTATRASLPLEPARTAEHHRSHERVSSPAAQPPPASQSPPPNQEEPRTSLRSRLGRGRRQQRRAAFRGQVGELEVDAGVPDPSRDAAEDAGGRAGQDDVLLAGYLQPRLRQRAPRAARVVDADMRDRLAVLDVRTRAFDVDVCATGRLAERPASEPGWSLSEMVRSFMARSYALRRRRSRCAVTRTRVAEPAVSRERVEANRGTPVRQAPVLCRKLDSAEAVTSEALIVRWRSAWVQKFRHVPGSPICREIVFVHPTCKTTTSSSRSPPPRASKRTTPHRSRYSKHASTTRKSYRSGGDHHHAPARIEFLYPTGFGAQMRVDGAPRKSLLRSSFQHPTRVPTAP